MTAPLAEVRDLAVRYGGGRFGRPGFLAVRGVDFALDRGETFALVGESGSGKSSVLRVLAGLHPAAAGRLSFDGQDITAGIRRRPARLRREMQVVFQNPDGSLNPRHEVATILGRPLATFHGLGAPGPATAPPSCWRRCGSTPPISGAVRGNCRGASGSASPSPGRWPPSRG